MVTARDDFLMNILHCGICDLSLLDDINYDMCDLLAQLDDISIDKLSINTIVRIAVEEGIRDIECARDERICELNAIRKERDLFGYEADELEALSLIQPCDDILSYHNFIDTHVWFGNNADVYRTYLPDALNEFAYNVGYEIKE